MPDVTYDFSECAPIPVARDALGKATNHRVVAARSEAVEEGNIGSGRSSAVTGVCAVAAAHT